MADTAVIARIDDLNAHPERIARWADSFRATDPVVLIIAPGMWSPERVAADAPKLFAACGIGEDDESARVVVLSQPLTGADLVRLADRCDAVYGDCEMPGPLGALPRVDAEDLKRQLRQVAPASGGLPPGCLRTPLGDGIAITHRDSHADREVIRQVFAERQYALAFLQENGWPGIARAAGGIPGSLPALIVDLGANIGASAMFFRFMCPGATIAAVEPEPENFRFLEHNTAALPGIRTFQNAIASRRGTVNLTDPGDGPWAFQAGAASGPGIVIGEVQAITLEDVIRECGEVEPFLLKVDIEGAESDLFSTGSETLARFPLVVVELHDRFAPERQLSRSFLRWHLQHDRDIHTVGEHIFSLAASLR